MTLAVTALAADIYRYLNFHQIAEYQAAASAVTAKVIPIAQVG